MERIDGVTGQILTEENALLKGSSKSIVLQGDAYNIMRSLLKIASGQNYVNNSTMNSEGGIMCFYSDEEYEHTKNILRSMGITYDDTPLNNAHKNEHNDLDNTPSPYPSNNGIKKNRTY